MRTEAVSSIAYNPYNAPERVGVSPARKNENGPKGPLEELSPEEQRKVDELKKRDAEVKAHERAHLAAGGPYISGGAQYEYERGPDNRNYAVSGEVSIDVSPENTPEATIRKMQVVKRAALAPSDPSPQDRSVAAQATQIEAQARIELQQQKKEEELEKKDDGKSDQPGSSRPSGIAYGNLVATAASNPAGRLINLSA